MPTPLLSFPSGNCPLFGRVTLHLLTSAAILSTLANGPIVAANSGIAVDANHQFLLSHQLLFLHHKGVVASSIGFYRSGLRGHAHHDEAARYIEFTQVHFHDPISSETTQELRDYR